MMSKMPGRKNWKLKLRNNNLESQLASEAGDTPNYTLVTTAYEAGKNDVTTRRWRLRSYVVYLTSSTILYLQNATLDNCKSSNQKNSIHESLKRP